MNTEYIEKFGNGSLVPMRIGLLMGSFDPFHNGHMAMMDACLEQDAVDFIWVIPTPQNPFKESSPIPLKDRAEIIRRHIFPRYRDRAYVWDDISAFEEFGNGESMYGYAQIQAVLETKEFLFHLFKDDDGTLLESKGIQWSQLSQEPSISLILGTDAIFDFPKWKNYQEKIRPLIENKELGLVEVKRHGYEGETFLLPYEHVRVVPDICLGISSSAIRKRLREGFPCDLYMSFSALAYCYANELYVPHRPTVKEIIRKKHPDMTDEEFDASWDAFERVTEEKSKKK